MEHVEQPASYLEIKTLIYTAWIKAWEAEDPSYSHSIDHIHRLPRKYIAIFRLRTGHFAFQAHLFEVGKASSPVCPCGFAEKKVEHSTGLSKPWSLHRTPYGKKLGLASQPRPDQQLPGGYWE